MAGTAAAIAMSIARSIAQAVPSRPGHAYAPQTPPRATAHDTLRRGRSRRPCGGRPPALAERDRTALVALAVRRMSDFQGVIEQARAALADRPLVVLVVTYVSMWAFAGLGSWLARRRLVDVE